MYCMYCGEQIFDTDQFCHKCGKAVNDNQKQSILPIEKSESNQNKLNNNLFIEIAVGSGLFLLMCVFGELVTYSNVYDRGTIIENIGSFIWYGVLFGFAVRAVPIISTSRKDIIESGVGGAFIGLVVATITYSLLYIAIEGGRGILLALGIVLFTVPLPLASSIEISFGKNGIKYTGIVNIKKNLLVGLLAGLFGWVLAMIMEAARLNLSMYGILGIIGFVNYLCLIRFGGPKHKNTSK